ncbi:lactate racemase domain-containing protein [Dehalococcoidia bacterium]|nr:lactate racemase domain-containing protein [Dehalococcoidia bacterium]
MLPTRTSHIPEIVITGSGASERVGEEIRFPKMHFAQRKVNVPKLADVRQSITAELGRLDLKRRIRPGMRVAVTAGSRGIANNVLILSTVVSKLKRVGAQPFLIPCMGSHGGATPEGQIEVLKSLGVTEESVGCPIISQVDVVELAHTPEGIPVYIDKIAADADGIVVINRVKPHTEYTGDLESGLMKMMAIGLGKHKGALTTHTYALQCGYRKAVPSIAREILRSSSILFGLAIVENTYDETTRIATVEPALFEETERELLKEANDFLPRLPIDKLDLLIVGEMGKEISGVGMDTNVIGRLVVFGEPEPESPRITRIVALDLTEATHGNAIGVGLADFVTRRLADKIDQRVTYINCFTAMTPEKARLPAVGETDREAIEWAFLTAGVLDPQQARIIKIKNTLHLDEIYVSESLTPELQNKPGWEVDKEPLEMRFDPSGRLHLLNP